uniref:C2H2-type domain-containing protein n=1 Tax=Naja naja TaxID=35670 RepID=A0A8C6XNX1_NAJNA
LIVGKCLLTRLNFASTSSATKQCLYQCQLCDCGKAFSWSSSLACHQRIHAAHKPYRCNLCGKGFTQLSSFQSHQRTHSGEKPFLCPQCGRMFSDPSSFRRHLRTHQGLKPYACDKCGKAFRQPADLAMHQRIHTGERPHKCLQCDKSFRASLTKHYRVHSGERPFKCSRCGKAFVVSSSLRKHERTHGNENSGDKTAPMGNQDPFLSDTLAIVVATMVPSCGECGKVFASTQELCRHERLLHPGLRPFPCPECGKGFLDLAGLRKHERIHSGVCPHACPHCSKAFLGASDLRKHLKTHVALENRSTKDTMVTATIMTYESLLPTHLHPHDNGMETNKDSPSDCLPNPLTELS